MPATPKGQTLNLADKLASFTDHWSPRVVAEMNDVQVKAVRFAGEFVWHRHDDTDEAFLVVSGEMEVEFRDRTETVRAGEMIVVPRGAEHVTRASSECCALVIEPRGVVNTGRAGGDKTAPNDVWA